MALCRRHQRLGVGDRVGDRLARDREVSLLVERHANPVAGRIGRQLANRLALAVVRRAQDRAATAQRQVECLE
jgi:hypothetical protein